MKTIENRTIQCFLLLAYLCFSSFFAISQHSSIDSLKSQLSIAQDKEKRLQIHQEIFDNIHLLQPKDILELGADMLALASELKNESYIVNAHYNIAVGHYYMGKYSEAIAAALTSAQLLEHQNEPKKKGDAYSFIGVCYTKKGDYVRALENLQKSHRISVEINDEEGAATALGNIAQIYVDIEDMAKAKETYFEVLKMFDAYGEEDFFKAVIYNNIGGFVMEQPDSAIYWLEKARAIFEKVDDAGGIAHSNLSLGQQHLKKKEYSKSLTHYEITKKTWESETHHFPPGLVEVYTGMAQCYEGLENTELADRFFEQAISLGEADSLNKYLPVAYLGKANILDQRGEYQEALRLTKAARQLEKGLLNETKAKELANSEIKYRTEEKEKELAQAELEIEKKARQNQQLLLGGILILLALFGAFQFWRNKTRLKRKEAALELSLKKAEANKLKELDSLKSTFFANISHEFRTPLTLILGPVQQALETVPASEEIEGVKEVPVKGRHLEVVRRNALRLQNLIDQLLELSKLDSGKMDLQVCQGNLIQVIRSLVFSFESLAERKRIHFQTSFPSELPEAFFDRDKWEKVLVNLLSNAFKFTPENGTIRVEVKEVSAGIRVSISDTGKGMDADETSKIFDRFYQVKSNGQPDSTGTGIGLSLVKELVELHRGQISVDSVRGKGTTFKLTLPFKREAFLANEFGSSQFGSSTVSSSSVQQSDHTLVLTSNGSTATDELTNSKTDELNPLLLIVEDNPDLRHFIAETMQKDYQVLVAANGKLGLETAIEKTPDLIISDVMMPEMDGFEMCETLKKDERTSHIPIILLTAKAGQRHKVEGLETGADAYLTKPFDEKELTVRARNLVEQRKRLKEQNANLLDSKSLIDLKPKEVAVTSADQRFLEKVTSVIEANMDNEFFSVEDLASEVAFSRSQLHRKLKAMIGKSPNVLIRDFRLTRAKELLEKGAGNVSEIAMEVGYSSVSYFTRSFKQAFGVSPSEV